jgi:hypothetical protein
MEYRPSKDFNTNPDINVDSKPTLWSFQRLLISYEVLSESLFNFQASMLFSMLKDLFIMLSLHVNFVILHLIVFSFFFVLCKTHGVLLSSST